MKLLSFEKVNCDYTIVIICNSCFINDIKIPHNLKKKLNKYNWVKCIIIINVHKYVIRIKILLYYTQHVDNFQSKYLCNHISGIELFFSHTV